MVSSMEIFRKFLFSLPSVSLCPWLADSAWVQVHEQRGVIHARYERSLKSAPPTPYSSTLWEKGCVCKKIEI